MKSSFFAEMNMNDKKDEMRTIGIVGVTIPGAIDCIKKINQKSHAFFVEHSHPNIILHQLDFAPTHHAQKMGRWDIVEDRLLASLQALNDSGADFAIIPANTVHKVIASLQSRSPIPIINILEEVSDICEQLKFKKVAIMGTSWTMSGHLYAESLKMRDIEEIIPSDKDQQIIQDIIFKELVPTSAACAQSISALLSIVSKLKAQGCDCIALACTELPLVLNENNCEMPVLDTTDILAEAALARILKLKADKTYQGKFEAKL